MPFDNAYASAASGLEFAGRFRAGFVMSIKGARKAFKAGRTMHPVGGHSLKIASEFSSFRLNLLRTDRQGCLHGRNLTDLLDK